MPKQIDYPRASMKNSLALCDAVNDLSGECSAAMAADKLNKQLSGAFTALIASAVKYGVLLSKKGQLKVTPLYRDLKLAYSESEASNVMQKIFLTPPLFSSIYAKFENKPLPIGHFEKYLIREFAIPDDYASRVASYFLEGAKQCNMLGDGNILSRTTMANEDSVISSDDDTKTNSADSENTGQQKNVVTPEVTNLIDDDGKFTVRIKGPGMDSLILINEEEDLLIVRAMLKKVEKRLVANDDFDA